MQWWLDFEYENYVIDDEFIASIRMKTDEITGKLLEKMKGTYANMNQMFEKAKNIFSPEELRAVGKLLGSLSKNDWKIIPEGKLISFSAIGYLGQYLIIVPEKEIVLVRMIAAENYKPNAKNASLINLPKLAKKL